MGLDTQYTVAHIKNVLYSSLRLGLYPKVMEYNTALVVFSSSIKSLMMRKCIGLGAFDEVKVEKYVRCPSSNV